MSKAILWELLKQASPSKYERPTQQIILKYLKRYGLSHRVDGKGNIWSAIPLTDGGEPQTLFTAHMDCVHNFAEVNPVIGLTKKTKTREGEDCIMLHPKSKQTALGGDDKVGIALMLAMLKARVPAIYCFTVEEECGLHGATHAAKQCPDHIKNAITFDRKGEDNLITKMAGGECCSDEFADDLIAEFAKCDLTFVKDPTGSITDTQRFKDKTMNHTNLSSAYYNQHRHDEIIIISTFDKLLKACRRIDWEGLSVVERPPPAAWSQGAYRQTYKSLKTMVSDALAHKEGDTIAHVLELVCKELGNTHATMWPSEVRVGLQELLSAISSNNSEKPPASSGEDSP